MAGGPTWVILGCGYTGERLAARLRQQGTPVVTVARVRRAGIDSVADVHVPESLAGLIPEDAIVVDSVPPTPKLPPHQPKVVAAAAAAGAARLVYLGSTGVYGRGDGSWVDEDTPVAPRRGRARARVIAERALFDAAAAAHLEAVVLRIAAIYGPGRGVEARLEAGSYRLIGDGESWTSRIHVDDLCTVIIAAGMVTPLLRSVYVVADDQPTTSRAHALAIAARLGLPAPASVPVKSVSADVADLALSNRRIRNARMKAELRVTLTYPTSQ